MAITSAKQAIVADLKEKLINAKGAVITSYKGLNVAQIMISFVHSHNYLLD